MANEHVNILLRSALDIFSNQTPVNALPRRTKKDSTVKRIAAIFVRSGKLAITHGIPNWMIAKASKSGTSFSGTHRISDIRKRFWADNPHAIEINPIEFHKRRGTYHVHDVFVLEWLHEAYLREK